MEIFISFFYRRSIILTISPKAIIGGEIQRSINLINFLTLIGESQSERSVSKRLGITHPIKIEISNPPNINNTPPKTASIVPRIFMFIAAGKPAKKIKAVLNQTAFFRFHPSRSIREDTGTSSKDIDDVIAAMYARAKKKIATILPVIPRVARPVGNEINSVPTVELVITSFNPKLMTTGKVTIPARIPTAVSILTIAIASLGKRLLLFK